MTKRAGPDGLLRKVTVALPEDVIADLGVAPRAEIRRIVTEHVRSRRGDAPIRDPETDGACVGPAVQ